MKASSIKQEDGFINKTGRLQGHFQKSLQVCPYINHYGIFWPPVSYPNLCSFDDSREHRWGTWWPPTNRDIQTEYSCD